MSKIYFQGTFGAYSHLAALSVDPDAEILPCKTFDDCFNKASSEAECKIIIPESNRITGNIGIEYLIFKHRLNIYEEHFQKIEHNLLGQPDAKLSDIKEVYSHPMALLQCKNFFQNYPLIKLVESHDTAEEAMKISEKKIMSRGAVAGVRAAEIYGLSIISESIQTIKNNVTRFVIVQKTIPERQDNINKAAWKFVLDHKRGSLATALNVVSDCNLNLTKIQSLPVIKTPGKYAFFVDVTFDESTDYFKAKSLLKIMATSFKVLGEYKSDKS